MSSAAPPIEPFQWAESQMLMLQSLSKQRQWNLRRVHYGLRVWATEHAEPWWHEALPGSCNMQQG